MVHARPKMSKPIDAVKIYDGILLSKYVIRIIGKGDVSLLYQIT